MIHREVIVVLLCGPWERVVARATQAAAQARCREERRRRTVLQHLCEVSVKGDLAACVFFFRARQAELWLRRIYSGKHLSKAEILLWSSMVVRVEPL